MLTTPAGLARHFWRGAIRMAEAKNGTRFSRINKVTAALQVVLLLMMMPMVVIMNFTDARAHVTRADGQSKAQLVLMSAITAAIFGGIIWGFVVDKIGPKKTLTIVLTLWMFVLGTGAAVGFMDLHIRWLFGVACGAGICLGGTWASDRPLMLRLTPPDRIGEFYGLYGMVGRFSAVTGPLLWGLTTYITVERGGMAEVKGQAFAILTLLAMVLVSFAILWRVSDERRDWATLKNAV